MRGRWWWSGLAALAVALMGAGARAGEDIERAKALFGAGSAAYAAGNYAAAAQAFAEAYAITPRPQLLFSLAQAERKLYTAQRQPQDLADAVKHYRQYIEQVPEGGRRDDAIEALQALEPPAARLGPLPTSSPRRARTRLMVSPSVKEAVVSIDGASAREAPVIEEVSPGKHRVKVSAEGHFDDEREVTAVEGTVMAVEVTLKERPARVQVRAPSGVEVTLDGRPYGVTPLVALVLPAGAHTFAFTKPGRRPVLRSMTLERGASLALDVKLVPTSQRVASYVVMGFAGAAAVSGAVLGGVALIRERHAKDVLAEATAHTIAPSRIDDYNAAWGSRDALRAASWVTLGAAGALAITGVSMYFFDHASPGRSEIVPVAVSGGAGVLVGGCF